MSHKESSGPGETFDPLEYASVPEGSKWYEKIPGVDGKTALKNSGSEDNLREMLFVFYDSIMENRILL